MKKNLLLPAFILLISACQNKSGIKPGQPVSGDLNNTQQQVKPYNRARLQSLGSDSVYGATVHFGQANNTDYLANKIGFAMTLSKKMNFNCLRTDVSMNSAGVPSNPAFQPFVDSAYNNGIGVFAVINNPADILPPANNTAYTAAELATYYDKGYNKGYGFTSRPALQDKIQFIQIFNELENDNNAAIMKVSYSGTQEAVVGQNDAKYDMTKYPAYLKFMTGAYDGIRAANSSIKIGTNYAWVHYGLFLRFTKDMIGLNKKLDFMLLNWYNVEEYGTDASHNVYSTDVAMAGEGIDRLKYKFFTQPASPLVDRVGISETGISFGQLPTPNPNNLSKGDFLTLMHDQYKPQSNFFFYYELFKELNTRSQFPKEAQYGIQTATSPMNLLVKDTLSVLH